MRAGLESRRLKVRDPVAADDTLVVPRVIPDVVGVGQDEVVELVVRRGLVQVLQVAHCVTFEVSG